MVEHAQYGLWWSSEALADKSQVEAVMLSWALLGIQHVAPYKDGSVGFTGL